MYTSNYISIYRKLLQILVTKTKIAERLHQQLFRRNECKSQEHPLPLNFCNLPIFATSRNLQRLPSTYSENAPSCAGKIER